MAKKHVHKYFASTTILPRIWRCALPACNHFMPPHFAYTVEGRTSICWGCNKMFTLDSDNMIEERPICLSCSSGIKSSDVEGILEMSDAMKKYLQTLKESKENE